jgi:FKBP12-rapamycin complex-associated protein
MVDSSHRQDRIGALMALDELLDVTSEESSSIVSRYLRVALKSGDMPVMELAAEVLGRLAKGSSVIITECIEFEIQSALEWLQGERILKKQAACLVLQQVAMNAPTMFYAYIPSVLELIWSPLRDSKSLILRECAEKAIGACLKVISERENRFRLQWYRKIFDETQKGFGKYSTPDYIHASLLVLGQLLETTKDFLKNKYIDLCRTVLKYKENRHKNIVKTVITLIPRFAQFNPKSFKEHFLHDCALFLLSYLKKDNESRVLS